MRISRPVYALYIRRLRRRVTRGARPEHVGLIMAGNRRWARQAGLATASLGHRYGVEHADVAATVEDQDIARHLYSAGQPDPDLVIRTSGEQRMSNFLVWQGVRAELCFCDAYWPAFREIDFLRAVRSFGVRRGRAIVARG